MSPEFFHVITPNVLMTSIIMGLVALVGLAGNAIMLRNIAVYPRMRTDFYTVFGSLSVADSLFLIIAVPANIIDMVQANHLNSEEWCKASFYLTNVFGFVASFLIVILSVLRAIMLTNRNTYRRPQGIHMFFVSCIVFIGSFLLSIPILNIYTILGGYCMPVDERPIKEVWLLNSFSAFVPVVLVVFIYMITYLQGKRFCSDSYSLKEKARSRLISSVIVAFIICQFPFRIVDIHYNYLENIEDIERVYSVRNYLLCLLMMDKAIRPILYSKLAPDLGEAFDEVINCTYCSKPYDIASTFEVNNSSRSVCSASDDGDVSQTLTVTTTLPSSSKTIERTVSSSSNTSQTLLLKNEDKGVEFQVFQD